MFGEREKEREREHQEIKRVERNLKGKGDWVADSADDYIVKENVEETDAVRILEKDKEKFMEWTNDINFEYILEEEQYIFSNHYID